MRVQDVDGNIKYQDVQLFTNRYGGQVLTPAELQDIFQDFDRSSKKSVKKDEFLMFFSKISLKQKNSEFNSMIADMT